MAGALGGLTKTCSRLYLAIVSLRWAITASALDIRASANWRAARSAASAPSTLRCRRDRRHATNGIIPDSISASYVDAQISRVPTLTRRFAAAKLHCGFRQSIPVEHMGELSRRDRDRAVRRRRPDKLTLLQPLRVERHAGPSCHKILIRSLVHHEDIEVAGMRIAMQRFLNLKRQRVHALTHVGPADRQPHLNARRNPESSPLQNIEHAAERLAIDAATDANTIPAIRPRSRLCPHHASPPMHRRSVRP